MSKLSASVIVLALVVGLGALAYPGRLPAATPQGNAEQKPDPKAPVNIAGKWIMTLEMSMGTATPSLELKQDGEKITGSYTGRYGTFALQGTLKERTLVFSFQMVAEGETVTMTFTGEVAADAQSMKGNAAIADMGEAAWTAKKEKSFPG